MSITTSYHLLFPWSPDNHSQTARQGYLTSYVAIMFKGYTQHTSQLILASVLAKLKDGNQLSLSHRL